MRGLPRQITRVSVHVVAVLVMVSPGYTQQRAPDCFAGEVHVEPRRIAGFLIQFEPATDKKKPLLKSCRVQVFAPGGGPVFQAADHAMSIDEISGKDVNGDGSPDAVFVGYSGGAHCCWTYWIVSLGGRPGLLKEVSNQTGIGFHETKDGHIDLWAGDGAFDYFDCLSHAESVFPMVFLRLQGQQLKDVGAEHWDTYADRIAEARKALAADELRQFRESKDQDEMCEGKPRSTMPKVLAIVFANLCGGKEEEAWKALDQMWPPGDKARIRKLILQKRAEGILRYTRPVAVRKK